MFPVTFCFIVLFVRVDTQTYSEMDNLLGYLFNASRYNKLLRPLRNQSQVLEVNLTQYLSSIEYMDISTGELLVTGFFEVTWRDELLTWNPSLYGGKEAIPLPKEMVWQPQIAYYNAIRSQKSLIDDSGFAPAWVNYQGVVLVVPAGSFLTKCDVDTTLYPFDKHKCVFQIFVANHDISELILFSPLRDIGVINVNEHGEWMIENTKAAALNAKAENIQNSISMFESSFTLKRRPAFEMINTFSHVTLMTILHTLTCFIRPDSGERLSFAVTLYLALVFSTLALIDRFPNNSLKLPYMSYEILMINLINTVSVAWSIYIVHLANIPPQAHVPVPNFIRNIALKNRKIKLHRSRKVAQSNGSDNSAKSKDHGESLDESKVGEKRFNCTEAADQEISGREVAITLDKLYFVLSSLIYLVISTVFLGIVGVNWASSGRYVNAFIKTHSFRLLTIKHIQV